VPWKEEGEVPAWSEEKTNIMCGVAVGDAKSVVASIIALVIPAFGRKED